MALTSEKFKNTFDDNDVQFEVDDNGERYISIYTGDTPLVRSLFRSDEKDTVEEYEEEAGLSYAEDYDIDIYTDYYPQTGDVKLLSIFHIDILPYGDDKDLFTGLNRVIDELDRVDKDGWVNLSQAEKEIISQAAKDYIGKETLSEFFNWCEEETSS